MALCRRMKLDCTPHNIQPWLDQRPPCKTRYYESDRRERGGLNLLAEEEIFQQDTENAGTEINN